MSTATLLKSESGQRIATPPLPPPAATVVLTDPERSLKSGLQAIAIASFVLCLAAVGSLLLGPARAAALTPPWGVEAVEFFALVEALALYASGDPRRRGGLAYILATVLGLAAVVTAGTLVGRLSRPLALWPELLLVVVTAGVAGLLFAGAQAARAATREAGVRPARSFWAGTTPGAAARILVTALGVVYALVAAVLLIAPLLPQLAEVTRQPVLTALAAATAVGMAGVAFYVARDTRERLPVVAAAVGVLVAGASARLILLPGLGAGDVVLAGRPLSARTLVGILAGAEAALAVLLALVAHLDFLRRLRPQFLGTVEYRALMALGDVLVQGPEEAVPPPDIAANVDRYLAKIQATRRWIQRATLFSLQLHPLLYFKPPLSELDEEGRLDHLKTHFQREGEGGLLPDRIRQFVQAMIRVAKQLTYVGYYADPRSYPLIGYQRFSDRDRFKVLDAEGLVPKDHAVKLKVTEPDDVDVVSLEADICIVGSGAAGAVLAYHLAEQGKSVVILERGRFVQPRDFSEDEVEMIGKLYSDGAFQQTEDFRFTVLQGSCVGGTTVVNNAVCFRTPEPVLERWNAVHGAGIDPLEYYASAAYIEQWLRIRPQDQGTPWNPHNRLNPSAPKYLAGVAKIEPTGALAVAAVNANVEHCLGCGYCNIGCRFGAKLSMLETALPWAQAAFGDRVRILSECAVERIVMDGNGAGGARRAKEVLARLPDQRPIRVRADRFVVSAGTIASSYLLMQSGVGKGLPVGRYVSFNMGAPLTAEFDEELDAFDGLQISHFGVPRPERGWVFETWWNPPVSQALNMPGWFEDHYRNMRSYRRLMAVGTLVGSERNARIIKALTGGPGVDYSPTPGDLRKLADGLVELGRILFAAGARRVMLNAWRYYEFASPNGLYDLPRILADASDVTLGTGHPQGGNAIGADPALSVVDPDFRVHGCANVYVCDASVIPSSLTVNPQLTVMTLAHYASSRILR